MCLRRTHDPFLLVTQPLWSVGQVKADKDNANLGRLKLASKGVTQATAGVVASTKSGKSQIEEKGEWINSSVPMDLHSERST